MATTTGIGTSGLVRQRLLAELNARGSAPAMVVAPAGFGKTTLLAHYADTFAGPVGWLSVNPADADAATLTGRLRDEFPVPLAPAGDPGAFVRAVQAAVDRPVLLVVDDAHALDGSDAETVLERLLVARPPHLHVLVGARRMPGFNLSRYELADLVVVDAERLRFRAWEAEQLLRDVYREPLPPADIAALTRRLGGWVAGLHLFHLSTRGHSLPERRAAVAALDGGAPLCRAYLARTVLAELPADLRRFLVRTCVFDVVTADRCDRVLGRHDSHARLAELHRLQAFTVSPDGGRSYRYHEVMRSHLAVSLADEFGADTARRYHAEAAALLEEEGALLEAARAHARAEDWSAVRRLLHRAGADVAETGVEPWRDLLPSWFVAEDPWLVLAEGRHRFSRGQLAGSMERFAHAAQLFSDEQGRSVCREATSRTATWLPGPARVPGHWGTWLRAATQRHPAVVAGQAEQLPGDAGLVVRIVASLLAGQVGVARALIAGADPARPGVLGLIVRLLRAAADAAAGDATASATSATEAEAAELPWLNRMARAAVAADGTEQSAKVALAVADECARDDDPWGQAVATGLAWLWHAGRDRADAAALAALVARCRRLDAGVLEAWARALQALAAAAIGQPDAATVADAAAAAARVAGVPGAQVAALVAAARTGGGRPDRLAAARRLAAECGLPARLVDAWTGPPTTTTTTGTTATGPPVSGAGLPAVVLCLGRFHAAFDGRTVELSRVKPRVRVLMRLLAMHAGGSVHRDLIVEALWPDVPADAAGHNLHVALWSLRKLLEPESPRGQSRLVVRDGDAYQLRLPPGAYCDVAVVRSGLADARRAQVRADVPATAAALRSVLAHYGGELLPADGGAEWVVHERELLRRAVSDAGATLAALELARGDAEAASAAAERGIAVDRWNDEAWRLLITAYGHHDPAAAGAARQRYAQVLTELGVDPAEPVRGRPRRGPPRNPRS